MSDIEKVLKDVVYGSVGAVAAAIEVGGNLAKTFVEKGQEAIRQGQERADELKQAVKDACEAAQADPGIDVSCLTRAQRDALRRQLDEMDAWEDAREKAEAAPAGNETTDANPADEACRCGDSCGCEAPCSCETKDDPDTVTYEATDDEV